MVVVRQGIRKSAICQAKRKQCLREHIKFGNDQLLEKCELLNNNRNKHLIEGVMR